MILIWQNYQFTNHYCQYCAIQMKIAWIERIAAAASLSSSSCLAVWHKQQAVCIWPSCETCNVVQLSKTIHVLCKWQLVDPVSLEKEGIKKWFQDAGKLKISHTFYTAGYENVYCVILALMLPHVILPDIDILGNVCFCGNHWIDSSPPLQLAKELLLPLAKDEQRKHKLKRLVQVDFCEGNDLNQTIYWL